MTGIITSIWENHLKTRSVGELARERGYLANWPIIIVPGFMSSGLELQQSSLRPDWNQQRLWISLQKLGFDGKSGKNKLGQTEVSQNVEDMADDDLTEMMEKMMKMSDGPQENQVGELQSFMDELQRDTVDYGTLSRRLQLPPSYAEATGQSHALGEPSAPTPPPLPPRLPPRSSTVASEASLKEGNPFRSTPSPSPQPVPFPAREPSPTPSLPSSPMPPPRMTSSQTLTPHIPMQDTGNSLAPPKPVRSDTSPSTPEDKGLRRAWMQHMILADDRRSDPQDGKIVVRAVQGIEGVDFLQPGFMMDFATYVFGPIIANLKFVGYNSRNLQAAPYDWRIAPIDLEKRDKYFSKLAQMVLDMRANNGGKPVVLLAHSMGCRVVHFWCKWVERNPYMGPAWLKTHVHSIVAMGGPFLGATKSIRGLITGDSMGLPFLSTDEAIWFSRSLATPAFLLNNGSWAPLWEMLHEDTFGFVRLEGRIYVTVMHGSIPDGTFHDHGPPNCYVELIWRGRQLKSNVITGYKPIWNDTFQLISETSDHLPDGSMLKVVLWDANKVRQDEFLGAIEFDLGLLYSRAIADRKSEEKSVMLFRDVLDFKPTKPNKNGLWPSVTVACAFIPSEPKHVPPAKLLRASKPGSNLYWQGVSTTDFLEMDGAPKTKQIIKQLYHDDPHFGQPFGPSLGYSGMAPPAYLTPPQVNRVHLIYGINLPTEVGFMTRRRHTRITRGPDGEPWHLFKLDKEGSVPPNSTLTARGGIIYETKNTKQQEPVPIKGADGKISTVRFCSGDGTVPYCSLRYPLVWNQQGTPVTYCEIPEADHRAMLNNDTVIQHLLDYVCLVPAIPRQVVQTSAERVVQAGGIMLSGIKNALKKN